MLLASLLSLTGEEPDLILVRNDGNGSSRTRAYVEDTAVRSSAQLFIVGNLEVYYDSRRKGNLFSDMGSTPIRSTMKKRWEFSQERLET